MSGIFDKLMAQAAETANAASATEYKLFPAGLFLAKIASYDPNVPRFWKANPSKGLPDRYARCYVPTWEIVGYFPSGDEDRDDFARKQLDDFGDWKGKRFTNVRKDSIPSLDPNNQVQVAGVGPDVFGLFNTQPNLEDFAGFNDDVKKFATTDETGRVEGGFVSLLSKEPTVQVPLEIGVRPIESTAFVAWLENAIAQTDGAYAVLKFEHTEYQSKKTNEMVKKSEITGIQSVG
jgi:hypothetical protein